MKKDIHPKEYREVVFKDMSNDETFITRSTVASRETIEIDGKEYPLVKLEITSSSHPFFTGKQKLVDTAGRVDKFRSRYGNRSIKGVPKELLLFLHYLTSMRKVSNGYPCEKQEAAQEEPIRNIWISYSAYYLSCTHYHCCLYETGMSCLR